ncbi:MAG: ABC transporter ATP-binding protein [Sulfurovum sp.]|nr:MAG: ABC transporter ATP-binding protein [Sulfurovum sp.]
MSPLLSVKNVSVFVGEKALLKKISFTIQKAEIFALVGESGSGKSLTSLAIMRLLPEALRVGEGEILFQKDDLFMLSEYEMQKRRGKSIAMIFQEPMNALNPVMCIGEQVAEVLRTHLSLEEEQIRKKVIALFEEVALKHAKMRYDWYPYQLSGGQRQRVMIAMALACEPELLIADEPTTALDVTIQAQVLSLLKEINQKRNLSILFITHDMGVVAQIADRVAVMREGEIIEQASCQTFFTSPKHPYTKALLKDTMQTKEPHRENTKENLLDIRHLKVYFPIKKGFFQRVKGYVKAVDDVTLSIAKGSTLALVGESGSGKSTLGKAILSLVEVTGGEIIFEKQNIVTLTQHQMKPYRRKIQIIFQDPFAALNPRMTIADTIREGMTSLDVGPKEKKAQDLYIATLLKTVELEPSHAQRYPHEFSGGQRQRIGIARALAVEPELIVCDEPTSALDVSVRTQILKLLKKLQKDKGISYLFITHDLSIVPMIADEVAVMKEGKIVEQGSTKEVMQNPQHDYTQKLLAAVPTLPQIYKKDK